MTTRRPVALVIDDDRQVCAVVARFATNAGFEVITCEGGVSGLEELQRRAPDVAIVDLSMPDVGGLEVLRRIRGTAPACEVVLMTGYATVDTAIEAIKLGALDYLTKPVDFNRLAAVLKEVRADAKRRRGLLEIESTVARQLEFCGMIGRSARMQDLFTLIRRLAPHVHTVLITGETGTGKELVARALHHLGPRRSRQFVPVNCSAIVETLFESELFGHVRGAFTGATDNKPGLFELADGGTLFLDEVGELPLSVQAKLLRVLETGDILRVGALEPRHVDVHVCAATNRDLRTAASAAGFRHDLFFRLNVVEVDLPPLRERREDIPYLVAAFVQDTAVRLKKPLTGLTAGAERLLVAARWDGNVRELRNVVERACILAEDALITERDLRGALPAPRGDEQADHHGPAERATGGQAEPLAAVERRHIVNTLWRVGGNKKAAAALLGLSRRALYRRLEDYDLHAVAKKRNSSARSPGEP